MRKPQFIAKQGRKPSGLPGQIVARVIAKETADENDFVLELLQLQPEDTVLEIGCGHGTLWQRLRRQPLAVFFAESTSRRGLGSHRPSQACTRRRAVQFRDWNTRVREGPPN